MSDISGGQKVVAGYWEGVNPEENQVESNKAVSIDASTYSSAVEVTPTSPKDAMAKVTVTLTNVSVSLYAWKNSTAIIYTKVDEPTTDDKALVGASTGITESVISAVADEFASITVSATEYTRYSDGDITIR